jgi:hypothetical protein
MSERERALDACEKLRLAIDDTQGMLTAIEGARQQMSMTGDELRGQATIIKERVNWLIRELDALRKQIGKVTRPGDSK